MGKIEFIRVMKHNPASLNKAAVYEFIKRCIQSSDSFIQLVAITQLSNSFYTLFEDIGMTDRLRAVREMQNGRIVNYAQRGSLISPVITYKWSNYRRDEERRGVFKPLYDIDTIFDVPKEVQEQINFENSFKNDLKSNRL